MGPPLKVNAPNDIWASTSAAPFVQNWGNLWRYNEDAKKNGIHVLMTNMEQKKYISKLFLHGSKLCCHISKQGEKARGGKSESQP